MCGYATDSCLVVQRTVKLDRSAQKPGIQRLLPDARAPPRPHDQPITHLTHIESCRKPTQGSRGGPTLQPAFKAEMLRVIRSRTRTVLHSSGVVQNPNRLEAGPWIICRPHHTVSTPWGFIGSMVPQGADPVQAGVSPCRRMGTLPVVSSLETERFGGLV